MGLVSRGVGRRGGRGCAIRRSVVTSPSGSGRETAEHKLAITAALLGGVVFQFIGGLPRVITLGVFSAFLLTTVIVRAYRVLAARTSQR
ncbi:MAG TPA: hypothetical protein VII16_14845 [Actinomycetes bacterium]